MSVELDRANSEFQGYNPKEIRDLAGKAGEQAVYLTVDAVASTVKAIALIVDGLRKFLDAKKDNSLKKFLAKSTDGKVRLSQDIEGSESEQVQKLLQLMNTPAGKYAPAGLEKMEVNVDGVDYIIVDEKGKVTQNSIQPLMQTETVKAMLAKNLVELPNSPNITPKTDSLAGKETIAQAAEIAERDLQQVESIGEQEITQSDETVSNKSSASPSSIAEDDTLDPSEDPIDNRLANRAETLKNRAKTEIDNATPSTELGDAIAAQRAVAGLDAKIDGLAAVNSRSNAPNRADVTARISSADKIGNGLKVEASTLDERVEPSKISQAEFNSKVIKPLPPIPPLPTQQQTLS
jgi:hypothetical protein